MLQRAAAVSVLLVALVAEFGWERGTIAGAFALAMLIAGCFAPVAGWLLDRYPPRFGMSLGGLALGLSALALAGMQTAWQLYVTMAVLFAPALALLNLGSLSAYLARLVSIPGRLLFGVLTDRFGGIIATQLSLGLSILAVIFVLLPASTWLLHVFAVVFGLSLGSRGVSLGALTADTFPGPEFGVIYGWITSGQLIGGAFGPWLAGLIFDRMGSYRLVFYGCIVGFAVSIFFVVLAAWGRRRIERAL